MPLVPLTCAWLVGVLCGALWPGARPEQAGAAAALAGLAAVALALAWPHPRARWAAALALAAWLGLARGLLALPPTVPPPGSLRALNLPVAEAVHARARQTTVRGRLLADPVPTTSGKARRFTVEVDAVLEPNGWRPVSGRLLALGGLLGPADAARDFVRSDAVECRGVLQDPPPPRGPGFDFGAWLAQQGIGSYMARATVQALPAAATAPGDLLASWRAAAGQRTAALLPEPEAGLLRAVVLGQQKAVASGLRKEFTDHGTDWLIVISGFHFTIFLVCVFWLLRGPLGLWPSILVAGLLTVVYANFVGLGVSVTRAALMGVLVLVARGLGRPVTPLNLLAVAALGLTAFDPLITADVGFQLSFAAVAGLLLLGPILPRRWRHIPVVGEGLVASLAVELAIWPLTAIHFGLVSWVGVPASVAGGLLLIAIMPLGALLELAGWLWLPLGQVLAPLVWLPLVGLAGIIHIASKVPGDPIPLANFSMPLAILWYLLLAAVYMRRNPEWRSGMTRLEPAARVAAAGQGAL